MRRRRDDVAAHAGGPASEARVAGRRLGRTLHAAKSSGRHGDQSGRWRLVHELPRLTCDLRRCVELAREALDDGDEPFGSVLVSGAGEVLYADRNRVKDGDQTRHPEFDIARWAGEHLPQDERAACTVYTSGEHCAMCSAAHAWVGLGRIVYAVSRAQLVGWLTEWGIAPGPVAPLVGAARSRPAYPSTGRRRSSRPRCARCTPGCTGCERMSDSPAAARRGARPRSRTPRAGGTARPGLAGDGDAARRPGPPDRDAHLLPAAGGGVLGLAQGRLRRALDGAHGAVTLELGGDGPTPALDVDAWSSTPTQPQALVPAGVWQRTVPDRRRRAGQLPGLAGLRLRRLRARAHDDRLTLVTGGTRGIGAAIALRLARDGHDLVLGYARDDRAAEEARLAVEDAGARCAVVRADLTDPDGVDRLFEAAAEHGRLTGVVNNAGATLHIGPLAETPPEVIAATVDLNLTSALLVARAAVRALGTSYGGRGGVLVNISSGAATLGSPGEYVQYAAAKAGVDALTVGLAQEVAADGIRVVGVAPGHRAHHDPRRRRRARPGRAGRAAGAARPRRRAARGRRRGRLADERRGVVRHRDDAAGRRRA